RLRLEKTGPFDNSGSVFGDTTDSGLSDTPFKFNYVAGYRLLGDFKAYMPSFISKFDFGPAVRHTWNSLNSDQYANGLGFDLETSIKLPLNLRFDTNVYLTNYWFSKDIAGLEKGEVLGDDALLVSIEAMLKGKWDVLKLSEKTKVNFAIEYGMDPYQVASEKIYGDQANAIDDKGYNLKARNVLTLEHKMTSATTLYTSVVGEYNNGIRISSEAKDWKWAPEVIVGWTTKF
ncbi:MAG: FomA family porin-like outer membrane protein, partial [Fusobacteriaceae bacterium]